MFAKFRSQFLVVDTLNGESSLQAKQILVDGGTQFLDILSPRRHTFLVVRPKLQTRKEKTALKFPLHWGNLMEN